MIGQLFYKKKLILSINTICIKYLKKNLKIKDNFLVTNFDKYNLIIRHFIYLLRLNKLEEKEYKEHIILLKLIIIYHQSQQLIVKEKLANLDVLKLKTAIENLTFKLNFQKNDYNIEKDKLVNFSSILWYDTYHLFYSQIANIFYNIKPENKAYYDYGYYLTMLFNIQTIKLQNNNECNLPLYQLKLTIVDDCISAISKIDSVQFNNFVRNYNKTLKKISKK